MAPATGFVFKYVTVGTQLWLNKIGGAPDTKGADMLEFWTGVGVPVTLAGYCVIVSAIGPPLTPGSSTSRFVMFNVLYNLPLPFVAIGLKVKYVNVKIIKNKKNIYRIWKNGIILSIGFNNEIT